MVVGGPFNVVDTSRGGTSICNGITLESKHGVHSLKPIPIGVGSIEIGVVVDGKWVRIGDLFGRCPIAEWIPRAKTFRVLPETRQRARRLCPNQHDDGQHGQDDPNTHPIRGIRYRESPPNNR